MREDDTDPQKKKQRIKQPPVTEEPVDKNTQVVLEVIQVEEYQRLKEKTVLFEEISGSGALMEDFDRMKEEMLAAERKETQSQEEARELSMLTVDIEPLRNKLTKEAAVVLKERVLVDGDFNSLTRRSAENKDEKLEVEEQDADALQDNYEKHDHVAKLHNAEESDDSAKKESLTETKDENLHEFRKAELEAAVKGSEDEPRYLQRPGRC